MSKAAILPTNHDARKLAVNMAKQLHRYAEEDTPTSVTVPNNLAGIFLWALGKHGPVVLFVLATWLLYNDNKLGQAQMLEVAKTQIAVNAQVVSQMTEVRIAITQLAEEAKKAHKANNP